MPLLAEPDGLLRSSPSGVGFRPRLAMALPSPRLAAVNAVAERRSRALHRFIVASPVLLLIAIGLVGHLRHRPYASPAGTAEYDRRVLAYRERVAAAQALPDDDSPPFGPYSVEASRWVAGFRSGALTPLTPATYEDHLQTGVRGEVFRSGLTLALGLAVAAERRLDTGHPQDAASGALLCAQTAHGLRGFEIQACLQSLLVQRRAMGVLAGAWPSLAPSARRAMRVSIADLRVDPTEVERMWAAEEARNEDYERRQRSFPSDVRQTALALGKQAVAAIRRSARASNGQIDALLHESPG